MTSSFAAEVDHFMGINVSIRDSAHIFNHLVNKQALTALEKMGQQKKSCLEAQNLVIKEFKNGIGYKVNNFMRKKLPLSYKYPHDLSKYQIIKNSVFQNILFLRTVPVIEEIINFNGIYLGIDKLSHFFAMGKIYFKKYSTLKNRGLSEDEISVKLFKTGHLSEKTYLGLWGTQTYSYADLESNYQGFLFFRNFCSGSSPYLIQDGDRWKLSRYIDIREYVSPYWNELFNPSYISKSAKKNFIKNAKKYCNTIRDNHSFKFRFKYYQSHLWKKSKSQIYFEKKISKGESPDSSPFELENLCSY